MKPNNVLTNEVDNDGKGSDVYIECT